jgi:hypothetical protein
VIWGMFGLQPGTDIAMLINDEDSSTRPNAAVTGRDVDRTFP